MTTSHSYPGAALEAEHDGAALVTVDRGVVDSTCKECGHDHLHRLTDPEDNPGGSHRGVTYLGCCACTSWRSDDPEGSSFGWAIVDPSTIRPVTPEEYLHDG